MRPVAKTLPDDGLLIGWSLESHRRRKVVGFASTDHMPGISTRQLEPILFTGEGHLITVAPTGGGKGVGCIIPALLRYPGPTIVVDPKGENYQVTARRRRELGQKVIVIDPFHMTNAPPEERGTFNPLDFLAPENPSLVEDAEMIASVLVSSAGPQHRDPFWPFMGGQLLTLLILYQLKCCPPEDWTLAKTRDLLAQSPEEMSRFGSELLKHDDPHLRRLAGVAANPAESTFGGYWAFAQMQTACLKGDMIDAVTGSSSFSLQEIVDGEPLSIYIVIPPDKLEAYGNLLKLWLTVMMAGLTQRSSKPDVSTLFIVDEAAQLGEMPQLRRAMTLLRGYGVKVWSFWQDLSQLQHLYPSSWQTMLNNCQVQQFMGQATRLSAEQTWSVTGLGSPEFLQTLEPGEMTLSVRGDAPVIAQVPNYLLDPPFADQYDSNPFYVSASKQPRFARSRRVYRRSEPSEVIIEKNRQLSAATRFHTIDRAQWTTVEGATRSELLTAVREVYLGLGDVADKDVNVKSWPADFYESFAYYEISTPQTEDGFVHAAYFLYGDNSLVYLDGDSGPIHAINSAVDLKLRRADILPYLYFFCFTTTGSHGRFLIIDELDDLTFATEVDEEYLQELERQIFSPTVPEPGHDDDEDCYRTTACVLYGGDLFSAVFRVHEDGNVAMEDDKCLMQDIPVVADLEVLEQRLKLTRREETA